MLLLETGCRHLYWPQAARVLAAVSESPFAAGEQRVPRFDDDLPPVKIVELSAVVPTGGSG
jgi:hypothetical protein